MDSDSDKEKKKYLTIKWIRFGFKIAAEIAAIIFMISCIPLLKEMSLYVTGEKIMENALTTSQLTGMLLMVMICYAMFVAVKIVRKL